jgi:type IV pilus assembly protein PilN
VKQTDKRLKFEGIAQSSTRVSTFMRNIDSSEWLRNPDLEVVETRPGNGATGGSSFTLFADQVSNAGQDEGKGKPAGPAKKLASRGAP